MAKGPPKKPTAQKILHGTFRKDRAIANEAKPSLQLPQAPSWLKGYALRVWKRLAPELNRIALLTVADRAAFAMDCQADAGVAAERKDIDLPGLVVKGPPGDLVRNPAVVIEHRAMEQVRTFAAQFGLTPASRAGIEAPVIPRTAKRSAKA